MIRPTSLAAAGAAALVMSALLPAGGAHAAVTLGNMVLCIDGAPGQANADNQESGQYFHFALAAGTCSAVIPNTAIGEYQVRSQADAVTQPANCGSWAGPACLPAPKFKQITIRKDNNTNNTTETYTDPTVLTKNTNNYYTEVHFVYTTS